jgi:hypothetical protein
MTQPLTKVIGAHRLRFRQRRHLEEDMRMRKRIGIVLAAAVVAIAAGASAKGKGGAGRVRLIHNYQTAAVPQPAAVDVRVGSNADPAINPVVIGNAVYGEISPKYLRVKGPATVGVFLAGTTTQILSASFPAEALRKKRLTLLARQVSSVDGAFSVEVLDDTPRKPKKKSASVRVIHGIPAAAANDVSVGVIGGPCLVGPVSYPANGVIEVPAGTYDLGVFPPSDPTCSGEPLPGLRADGVKIRPRKRYTAIAQVKEGDPAAFQLQLVRDF